MSVGHRPLHRRFMVLRRTAACCVHSSGGARLRESGGVSGKSVDRKAAEEYLREVDLPEAIAGIRSEAATMNGLRQSYLTGLAHSLEVMWDLAMEILGKGAAVPYARCVEASTGKPPEPSNPKAKRERVAELLGRAGHQSSTPGALLEPSMPGGGIVSFQWLRCAPWAQPSSRTSTS